MFRELLKRKRGEESPDFPWENDLGGWALRERKPFGKGTYGQVFECSRHSTRAVCKVIEWSGDRRAEAQREVECQQLCARFAPRVYHAHVGASSAVIVMEMFPTNVERLLAQLWEKTSFDAFAELMANLIPRFLLQIDGFRAPTPNVDIMHGDLSPQNVLVRYVEPLYEKLETYLPHIPEFRLVACDFGYSTLYVSGLPQEPLLARAKIRRPTVYDGLYDRCFFLATTLGMLARWSKLSCREWVDLLGKLGPAREGLRPSLAEELETAIRYVKRFSKPDMWQDCAGWDSYFSKPGDGHSDCKHERRGDAERVVDVVGGDPMAPAQPGAA